MKIRFINRSSFPESDFSKSVIAVAQQFREHVVPAWKNFREVCEIVEHDQFDAAIYLVDNDSAENRLGYHSRSTGHGTWGIINIGEIKKSGYENTKGDFSVSSIMSHEAIESYCDPFANLWVMRSDGKFIAYEPVDPVEGYSYEISNVSVSNFVYPAWFDESSPLDCKFDEMGKTKKPLTISDRGRCYVLHPANGTARHVYGDKNERRSQSRRDAVKFSRML